MTYPVIGGSDLEVELILGDGRICAELRERGNALRRQSKCKGLLSKRGAQVIRTSMRTHVPMAVVG